MPASAPFPPPLPVPDAHDGWAPPPSPPSPRRRRRAAARVTERRLPRPVAPHYPPLRRVRGRRRWRHGRTSTSFRPAPVRHNTAAANASAVLWPAARRRPRTNALPPTRSVSPRTEIGQLVENIPRTMRIAVPALIEVRVARADVQALAEGLQGGGAAYQHEVMVTKAMSVRLRAPDGGFYIETASPETQWIEKAMLLSSEDFASWRWHVTPRDRGRRRLQLIISARTVSADGLAAETALPDQVITVRVRTNYAKAARRWIGWGAAAVVGGLLAKFGEGTFDAIGRMLAG